jgi:hypothetical protein
MQQTIELTPKTTKWMYVGFGLMNTGIGLNLFFRYESWIHWTSVISFLLIIGGPILMTYGIILFNPSFKYAPKVQVSDQKILIKSDIHKKEVNINWKEIKGITFKFLEGTSKNSNIGI